MRVTPLAAEFFAAPYNTIRRIKLCLFDECFGTHPEFRAMTIEARLQVLTNVERACLNATVEKCREENIPALWTNDMFVEVYTAFCGKIASNIDMDGPIGNQKLARQILDGSIHLQELPRMPAWDLFPEKYAEMVARMEMSKTVEATVKTSSMYKCRRCHKNKCKIENRYNRSLDEGVNLMIECVECGFQWCA